MFNIRVIDTFSMTNILKSRVTDIYLMDFFFFISLFFENGNFLFFSN